MIELARRKAARAGVHAKFDVGVVEALPYPDGHFDVVLSSLMLHHLPDDLKRGGLAEVHRAEPAGRLVAIDFGATPGKGIGHLLCVLGQRRGSDDAEQLYEMFRKAGFDADEMGPLGFVAWPCCAAGSRPGVGTEGAESMA